MKLTMILTLCLTLLSACGDGDDPDFESCYSDRNGTVCCRTYCDPDGKRCTTYCS